MFNGRKYAGHQKAYQERVEHNADNKRLKLVSAAKLRKAKATFEKTTEYFNFITHTIEEIFNNNSEVPPEYLAGNREIKNTCYIVVTSCRGLCGGFNNNIIKEAEKDFHDDWEKPVIVAIGTKGKEYFEKRGYEIYKEYLAPPEDISFLETREISKPIIDMYDRGEIDEIVLIYTGFKNSIEQEVKNVILLPFVYSPTPISSYMIRRLNTNRRLRRFSTIWCLNTLK